MFLTLPRAVAFVLRLSLVAATLFGGLSAAARAEMEKRLALVIGNSAYDAVPALDNPTRDARLIGTALEQAGFEVTLVIDARQSELNRAIARFGRDLRAGGPEATGLFYYAGHGVQGFGTNYLLPVDAALTDAADLPLVGLNAEAVLRQMNSARNATNIVILDACRDNPFQTVADLDDNGLAEMKAPTGTFLAYSTAPGAVALDGIDGNSPFTAALAEYITEPGLQIEQLFKSVRIDVLRATNGRQVPWDTSSLTRDFAFVPDTRNPEEREAEAFWASIKDSGDPVQVLLFLRAHPRSALAPEARELLTVLIASEAGAGMDMEKEMAALDEPSRAAPAPEPAPAPVVPAASERDLIEQARTSGTREDYQAYLDAYPEGVYAELAAFEISILDEKAASQAAAPAPAPEFAPAPAVAPAEPLVAQPLGFSVPLSSSDPAVDGRSIEQLIAGSPLFPPIEGLPDEVWKGKTCSNCHNWEQANLCEQGQTYLKATSRGAMAIKHPYGGAFKAAVKSWAGAGCP